MGFVLEKRREKVNSGEEYFQQLQTLAFAVFYGNSSHQLVMRSRPYVIIVIFQYIVGEGYVSEAESDIGTNRVFLYFIFF